MKILIIDDEPLVRRALVRALQKKKHQVVEAADGAEGLRLWHEQQPQLIFLDVVMPVMGGREFLAKLPVSPSKIILMSAHTGVDDSRVDEFKRAVLFIRKPFEDIFEIVNQAEELFK
jgi:CheY-like chemotaxis protein